jgi:hypothetical protein
MTLERRYSVPAEVVTRTMGEEMVLVDLAGGAYYGLDPVGARILELIAEERTLAEVRDALLAEYEVEGEVLARDILRLVDDLSARNLVRPLA